MNTDDEPESRYKDSGFFILLFISNQNMEVQLVSKELEDLLKKLDNSPLHHLSLASLETFHSNCWAWLIEKVDSSSVTLFDPAIKYDKEPIVHREKHIGGRKNKRILDLLIEVENGGKRSEEHT